MSDPKSLLISEVKYPEAVELADLVSIIQDLDFCIKTCERLIQELDDPRRRQRRPEPPARPAPAA